MTRLERRSGSQENLILERRFIRTVLKEEGADILQEQTRKMGAAGFRSRELFANRKIDATDTVLSFDHLMRHRFIDMKRRRTQSGVVRKKNYPIHNRILYGFANNIVRRLSFGFTENTREIMQSLQLSPSPKKTVLCRTETFSTLFNCTLFRHINIKI